MMLRILLLASVFVFSLRCFSQVGIGTQTPNAKAALEIKSTDKGVLFPRLTTAQRDAITNVPDGLHIFNTDERCLNYYDSINKFWNCYCADCQSIIIEITEDVCKLDFYNAYAKYAPAKKYVINIHEDVYIYGCSAGDTALSFTNMPAGVSIIINNNGIIQGSGGRGGDGYFEAGCFVPFPLIVLPGTGGAAIITKAGVTILVNNYGLVAGGGGGGGGSRGATTSAYGGGGGGGAGVLQSSGGQGGGIYGQTCGQFGCSPCIPTSIAQNGGTSTNLIGGTGGAGNNGGPAGGNGGGRGQAGQSGSMGAGGAAGKAIAGGFGNMIINSGIGQSFGTVD